VRPIFGTIFGRMEGGEIEIGAVWHRARIRLHEGKTRIWNSAGEEPSNIADLRGDDGAEPVWVGDWSLPPGITVLGSSLGHDPLLSPGTWSANARTTTDFSSVSLASTTCRPLAPFRVPTTCCASCPPPHRHLCSSTRCSRCPLTGGGQV